MTNGSRSRPIAGAAPPPDRTITAALFAGVFLLYAAGASRTIFVGDSGELVTAVFTLGIPHPTGYPLYVLLGKLFTLLVPAGSIAFRMSLFSAAFAAGACALVYRIARRLELTAVPAALGALLLAVAPSFWAEANIQRVYTLNAFFVAAATLLALRFADVPSARRLAALAFTAGLGASNHTYMAVFVAALAAFAVAVRPRVLLAPRWIAAAALGFFAGLLPYLYLPLRSRADPPLDWGNPETFAAFRDVVTRRDFWNRAWIRGAADLVPITADYLRGLAHDLSWPGALLALVGVLAALFSRARRPFLLLAAVGMAGNLLSMALHGSRSDLFIWHRYYIPSVLFGALLSAIGAEALRTLVPHRATRFAPVLLALPLALGVARYAAHDRHRFTVAEDFSKTVYASLPPGAHIVSSDDNILFVLMYLHFVEGMRPDVDLILQGVGGATLAPLRFDPDRDPLYFSDHPNWNVPELETVPVGTVFRICRRGNPAPAVLMDKALLAGERDPRVPKDYLTQNLIGHFHYMRANTFARTSWGAARREFDLAAKASPNNDVLFYNLGLIYWGYGLFDDALAAFRRSKEINPREILNEKKPKAVDRVAELEELAPRVTAELAELGRSPDVARFPAGSPARHRALAEALRSRGEDLAAQGEVRRAEEAEAGLR